MNAEANAIDGSSATNAEISAISVCDVAATVKIYEQNAELYASYA